MNFIKLFKLFCFLIDCLTTSKGQERKLSRNLQHSSEGENFIENIDYSQDQNQSSSAERFFDSFEIEKPTSTLPSVDEKTLVTKYPILIPKVGIEDIEEDDINIAEEYQSTQAIEYDENNKQEANKIYFKRACGDPKERCFFEGMKGLGRPQNIDFMREPFYCRCDQETCNKYGDCCYTVFNQTLMHNNPWRCHRVQHEMMWALMISKCKNPDDPKRISCESPDLIPEKQQTYLHDLPVYNNITQTLYRNLFCAQCNNVPQEQLYNMELQIKCSKNFTLTSERETFISRARYVPGERKWTDRITTCEIFAPELDQYRLSVLIPEIRFCRRNSTDYCPSTYSNPVIQALCHSYTQYVISRYDPVFKNPHCAECHGTVDKRDLKCLHDKVSMLQDSKISPVAAGASLGSAGLSFVFDFNLGRSEEGYVGYDMICTGNNIWDFLRQKCTPIECPQGQVWDLATSSCNHNTISQFSGNESTFDGNDTDSTTNSSCFILLIYQDEYTMLKNKSVLVNQSGEESGTLIFHPGEYKFWNATVLSICAQKLAKGFAERFSPILNYMSLTALGISVFFSALHTLVFILLPKMRNLPGKNLFCLTLSLLISQLVFLTLIRNDHKILCLGASITMHYLFLASFFWMNIMSLDIWRTFSSEFMMRRSSCNNNRTFIKYSLFAWTMPGLIVGVACLTDFWLADEYGDIWPILRRIRPLYGLNGLCWISQGLSLFIFFALPVLIIICLNIILFTLTAKAIMDQSQDTFFRAQDEGPKNNKPREGQVTIKVQLEGKKICGGGGNSSSGDEVDRMKLYVKLGVIMGVTWILGFLSGISGWDWLWYPFVILNGLQGTFIFFGFDFKVKVWEMLKDRLGLNSRHLGGLKNKRMSRRDTTTNSTFGSNSTTQIGSVSNKLNST